MDRAARTRRYVPAVMILLLRPLLRYSFHRDAYVLRVIGNTHGPVLRRERRRRSREHPEPERRRLVIG